MEFLVKAIVISGLIVGLQDSTPSVRTSAPSQVKQASEPSRAKMQAELLVRLGKKSDQDLRKLDDRETDQLLADLKRLIPNRKKSFFRPWFIWSLGTKERPYFLLLEASDTGAHPGTTHLRLTEFDPSGKLLVEATFTTGHRCYLTGGINLAWVGGGDVIVLGTSSWPHNNARIESRQYYAKVGTRYDLVRVEDAAGDAVQNTYYLKHFRYGPPVPAQNAQQWEGDLLSNDRPKVLRALVWLGGLHRAPTQWALPQDGNREEAELVRAVRMRVKVTARLKELAGAPDRWLRDEAQLALYGEESQSKGKK